MPVEEIDLVDEILGPDAAARWMAAQPRTSNPLWNTPTVVELPTVVVERVASTSRRTWWSGFAIAFVLGIGACVAILAAVSVAAFNADSNRVVSGVRVGSVDLSGLTRDEAVARLKSSLAYVGDGNVTVTTPSGTATITYAQVGRSPDAETIADDAIRIGHSGNPLADAIEIARTAASGRTLPVIVRVDPLAVATDVRQMAAANQQPRDAQAAVLAGTFTYVAGASGRGIDEPAISAAIIDHLTTPDAPALFQAGGAFVELKPHVGDADAKAAISAAQKMTVAMTLTFGGYDYTPPATPAPTAAPTAAPSATPSAPSVSPGASRTPSPSVAPTFPPLAASPSPSAVSAPVASGGSATPKPVPSPSPSPTPSPITIPLKAFTIDPQTITDWIVFATRPDGTYGPVADTSRIESYLSGLSKLVRIVPVEPKIAFNKSGSPSSLTGARDGTDIDVTATSKAIADYLGRLAGGGSVAASVAAVPEPISPTITASSLSQLVQIGAWTTSFYPDISNGNGANIRVPAGLLNGQIVAPGQQFSFLSAVAPIDLAHGYAMGGVIEHGKSDHTGAIGGGICSASTTMFNAAARAGLQIDERHPHFYYIDRYPVGLDATVYSNGNQLWDLKWTNDTPNPIVILTGSTYGSKSTVTVQLWSLPLNRTVTFSPEYKANVVLAGDSTAYTTSLAPGKQARAEYPTNGYETSRTRTVTDSTGKVIHTDTWSSKYAVVNGLLLIGK